MKASVTNQKSIGVNRFIAFLFIGLPICLLLVVLVAFGRDSSFMNNGIVTQGTIDFVDGCEIWVSYTDNTGMSHQDVLFYGCGNWSEGDSITIVYVPDSSWLPTLPDKQLPEEVQLEGKELEGLVVYVTGEILLLVLWKRGFLKGNWLLTVVSKGEIKPWWQILIVIPTVTVIIFFTLAPLVRYLVGLPFHTSSQGDIVIVACISDSICWMVFAVVGHRKQNFWKYFSWSVLVLYLAIIAMFLIPG